MHSTSLTVLFSAFALQSASAASIIALNFKGDASGGANFGEQLTQPSAFGVAQGDWTQDINGDAIDENLTGTLFTVDGVDFVIESNNDWSQDVAPGDRGGFSGDRQVGYGYFDDGGLGTDITITGLSTWLASNNATEYTVQIVAAVGKGNFQSGYEDVNVLDSAGGNTLGTLTTTLQDNGDDSGQGLSSAYTGTSDEIFIDGNPNNNGVRGSIGGLIITAVPEPGSAALLTLGGLTFLLRRRR